MYRNKNRYGNRNPRRRPPFSRKQGRNHSYIGERIAYEKYISQAAESAPEKTYDDEVLYRNFNLHELVKTNISKKFYVNPTKIQALVIPVALEGQDIIALASTGSGKTAAFLIPLINKVISDKSQKVLIVTPTRELANQIKVEFDQFSLHTNIKRTLLIGGESINRQISELRHNPTVLIGTPGRIIDLHKRKVLNLSQVNNIVLDEVDRMLDMGFVRDIKSIISFLKTPRQSMFFSATMSAQAEEIARTLLVNPIKIEIEHQSPKKNVEQNVIKISSDSDKLEKLHDLLNKPEISKVLIFARTKHGTDRLTKELQNRGFKTDSIHGNKTQAKRSNTLRLFRQNQLKILVATDVASRGIDVPDITHVINYDEPATYEDYIHRIGRTGRIGKKGFAYTFVK